MSNGNMKRRRLAIGVVVALLLGAVGFKTYGWWLKHQLDRYRTQLTAQGEKLTLAELLADHKVPDQNGASAFLSAIPHLNTRGVVGTNAPPMMRLVAPGKALIGWQVPQLVYGGQHVTNRWEDLAADVDASREGFVRLEEAAAEPVLDFDLNYAQGFTLMLPHLAPLKGAAQILAAAAMLDLHRGNATAAARRLHTLLGLVRGMQDERLVISQLVRMAMFQIAVAAIWEYTQSPAATEADLQMLQTDLAAQDFSGPVEQSFEMERAMSGMTIRYFRDKGSIYDMYASGSGAAPASTNVSAVLARNAEKLLSPREIRKTSNEILWQSALSYEDERRALRSMQVLIECARAAASNQPYQITLSNQQARLAALGQLVEPDDDSSPSPFGSENDSLASIRNAFAGAALSLQKVLNKVESTEINRALAISAIALKRHQLQHGAWPDTLTALVPEYLSAAPRDPVDGHPLRYRRSADGGFVLYSVGTNGTDDGGDPNRDSARARPIMSAGRDWVWPQPATAAEIRAWETNVTVRGW